MAPDRTAAAGHAAPVPSRALLPIALLLAALLAGCVGGDGETSTSLDKAADVPPGTLEGYVFDTGIRPLANATVKVLDSNATVGTDANGHYRFEGLATERFLVLVATKATFDPSSMQVTLPAKGLVLLNFTLQPTPIKKGVVVVDKFEGFLACSGAAQVQETTLPLDCSSGQESANADVWEFTSGRDLAGAVIEVFWEPTSPTADSLSARLETLGLGDRNLVLGETVGESPLRLVIPADQVARYFSEAGQYRLTVSAQPNGDETEAGAAASIAFQQPFQAFYSLFYVIGPSPSYSVADQA